MDDEQLTHDELKERLRTGWQLLPDTPGLREAAQELIRPIIEKMRGKEIIYRCRVPWLVRIDQLTVDDEGFTAVATPIQEISDGMSGMEMANSFEFGASWEGLRLMGSVVQMNMLTDHFFPDQAVVAEAKAAVARGAKPKEISEILGRARIHFTAQKSWPRPAKCGSSAV